MKILYLHPNAWGGEYAMLRRLQTMGHQLCVLEEQRDLPQGARWWSEYFHQPGDGIATFWYDPRRGPEKALTWAFDRVFRSAFEGRNLAHRMWIIRAALRRFDPDVVICSDGFSYAIPASFLKRTGFLPKRLVVGYIGGDILDCPQAAYGKRRTWLTDRLIKLSLAAPDVLRPVSPLLEKVLLRDGAPTERVHMCPSHLVAPRETLLEVRSRRKAIAASLRTRHGISAEAPVVVTLGLNQQGKGLHILAKGWPAVVKAYPEARWLLCGPQTPWIVREVWPVLDRHGLRDTVIETDRLAEIAVFEHLAAADLHINPSLGEGLNMVTVEAASVGTPTVTSDAAGIAHWVQRFGAGTVVGAGEAEALADAILLAFGDRGHLARWAQGAQAMAEEFTMERIAVALQQLLVPRAEGHQA
jgi:glycosyltransferase involved in cell wall biosynthesis